MTRKRNAIANAPQRQKAVSDFSHQNAEGEVNTMEKDKNPRQLHCSYSLRHFMNKLQYWQIDDHRWALLRRTPFGKLIKYIVELDMNVEVVDALLGFWDEKHCGFSIGGVIIPFSVNDIALITGLPNRGLNVFMKKTPRSKSDVQKTALHGNYLNISMVERKLDLILANKDGLNPEEDKLFVQLMILFLWVCVMFPPAYRYVPLYMLPYLENLDAIGSFNWAKALHSFLVKEICVKSKLLMRRIKEQRVTFTYINCLSFAINVWLFEHVNFGEDFRPSNPDALPRILKWAGGKFWGRKAFLLRLSEIGEDKVSLHLVPKNEELELVSHPNVEHVSFQIGCSDGAETENSSLLGNCIDEESCFKSVCAGMENFNTVMENEKMEAGQRKEAAEVQKLKEVVDGIRCSQTFDKIFQPKNVRLARGLKRRCRHDAIGKKLRPSIKKEQLMVNNRRGIFNERLSVPGLILLEKKDSDILVNLDDYACPIEQEAKAAPLNYVGREFLTENERIYLDAFCGRPMQRDNIVFFDWNITIRRQSMVDYLQGGSTHEEIIDAYAHILSCKAKLASDRFASFFYVPPMFMGLYRNKLGSYKTFLNALGEKPLKKVKFLFLPCHISNSDHWLLLVCDIEMQKWIAYDSLYDPRHREVVKEQRLLLAEYLYEDYEFDSRYWSLEYRRRYPQQEPGTLDCGVFVMKFIETIIGIPRAINFRDADMRLFRAQIAYEILCRCKKHVDIR